MRKKKTQLNKKERKTVQISSEPMSEKNNESLHYACIGGRPSTQTLYSIKPFKPTPN